MTTAFEYSIIRLQEAVKERENSIKEYQSRRLFSQFDIDDNNSMIHEAEEEKREYENAIKLLSEHSTKEPVAWLCEKGEIKTVINGKLTAEKLRNEGWAITPLVKK